MRVFSMEFDACVLIWNLKLVAEFLEFELEFHACAYLKFEIGIWKLKLVVEFLDFQLEFHACVLSPPSHPCAQLAICHARNWSDCFIWNFILRHCVGPSCSRFWNFMRILICVIALGQLEFDACVLSPPPTPPPLILRKCWNYFCVIFFFAFSKWSDYFMWILIFPLFHFFVKVKLEFFVKVKVVKL